MFEYTDKSTLWFELSLVKIVYLNPVASRFIAIQQEAGANTGIEHNFFYTSAVLNSSIECNILKSALQ